MNARIGIALILALCSATLVNLAYLREHEAAVTLPPLCMRHPVRSLMLLLRDRRWLLGFLMESGGFALYVAALALASVAIVQSAAAGGIGVLAFVSARVSGRPLSRRELTGVVLAFIGLLALGVSLARASGEGSGGTVTGLAAWLGATAALAIVVRQIGSRWFGLAIAQGVAGGLFFSIGDISTKVATQGGARVAFAVPLILGYVLGTSLLQLGYQHGGALTVAGLATLLTTALPIAAGTIVLREPVPSGALGVLRVLAFAAVTAGAILLAHPGDRGAPDDEPALAVSGGG